MKRRGRDEEEGCESVCVGPHYQEHNVPGALSVPEEGSAGSRELPGDTQVTCPPRPLEEPHLSKVSRLFQLWSDRVGKGWQKRRRTGSQSLRRLPLPPRPNRFNGGTRESKAPKQRPRGDAGLRSWPLYSNNSQNSVACTLTKPFLSISILDPSSHSVPTTTWDAGLLLCPTDTQGKCQTVRQTYRSRPGFPQTDQAKCPNSPEGPWVL